MKGPRSGVTGGWRKRGQVVAAPMFRALPVPLAIAGAAAFFYLVFAAAHAAGAVHGSPLFLTLVIVVLGVSAHESVQRRVGGGRLDNRPAARMGWAYGLIAIVVTTAGWSFLLPASGILVAAIHIQWSGARTWRTALAVLAPLVLAVQATVQLGFAPSILPPGYSHTAAGLIMIITVIGLGNLGVTAADREAAATALRRAEARFRTLVHGSSDLVSITDADGVLRYVSPAAIRLTGWEPAELVGRRCTDLMHPEDVDRARTALTELLEAGPGTDHRIDLRFRRPDGGYRWYEAYLRNLLDDPAVAGIVINQRDITDRRRHHDELAHAASHDALTGLPNRAQLLGRLASALRDIVPGRGVAVHFLDLNGFKQINDTLGHAAGDELLIAAAHRLKEVLRPHDLLGRLGGDEFVVVLGDVTDPAAIDAVRRRLVAALREPFRIADGTVSVGASIGTALTDDPTTDAAVLLELADAEMYRVKRAGRDEQRVSPTAA
ncbi:diguanylate cyclase [Actinoplanes sp. NPDC049548]|uniref:diguanylate cyclase domain-containing protein n=1 Tax=Actinoplanes sp. NPDC049548 TaxID=3155152 RepID=UPI00343F728D